MVCDSDVKYTPGMSRVFRAVWRLLSRKDDGEVKKGMMSGSRLLWLASPVDETGREKPAILGTASDWDGGGFFGRAQCPLHQVDSVTALGS